MLLFRCLLSDVFQQTMNLLFLYEFMVLLDSKAGLDLEGQTQHALITFGGNIDTELVL